MIDDATLAEIERVNELLTPWTTGHDLDQQTWLTLVHLVAEVRRCNYAMETARTNLLVYGHSPARSPDQRAYAQALYALQHTQQVNLFEEAA